jgi:hypothetical protein
MPRLSQEYSSALFRINAMCMRYHQGFSYVEINRDLE